MKEHEIIRGDASVDMRFDRGTDGTVTLTVEQEGGALVLSFNREVWADFRKRVRRFGK